MKIYKINVMTTSLILLISAVLSFLGHELGEKFFSNGGRKKLKLVFKGRQIHHSFWGAVSIAIAMIFTQGAVSIAILGYGLGNIWQHKITHNRVNERGIVFISKV